MDDYTVTSTLFYGIFVEAVKLAIAVKAHSNLIDIYDAFISELTESRTHAGLANIPLEIWQHIKDELKEALGIELKLDLVRFLACDCCRAGGCSDLDYHSDYSSDMEY